MPSLNLSQDYQVIDDTVTVHYIVKLADGNSFHTPVSVPYVFREQIKQEDVEKVPALKVGQYGAFHLWVANLSGIVPAIKDKIQDNLGVYWVVMDVMGLDYDASGVQRYRCACLEAITQ